MYFEWQIFKLADDGKKTECVLAWICQFAQIDAILPVTTFSRIAETKIAFFGLCVAWADSIFEVVILDWLLFVVICLLLSVFVISTTKIIIWPLHTSDNFVAANANNKTKSTIQIQYRREPMDCAHEHIHKHVAVLAYNGDVVYICVSFVCIHMNLLIIGRLTDRLASIFRIQKSIRAKCLTWRNTQSTYSL